jgi:hypothetical protein
MRNFTATETFAWGSDNREPEVTDAYETLIVDGWQRWHRQGNKNFYSNVQVSGPKSASGVVSGRHG